tara:strand:+ start:1202 stop:1504 length:303 start_codon:yes stop_codon:yes gene_type:complete
MQHGGPAASIPIVAANIVAAPALAASASALATAANVTSFFANSILGIASASFSSAQGVRQCRVTCAATTCLPSQAASRLTTTSAAGGTVGIRGPTNGSRE